MTNPTPRDSAQPVPFPHHPEHAMTWMDSEKRVIQAYAEAYAREALRAQAASVEPVGHVRIDSGEVHFVPRIRDADTAGFTDGQKLYAGAPPAHIPADVEALLKARVAELEQSLSEVLAFQSAANSPSIHDYGRWRRAYEASPLRRPQAVAASPATAVDAGLDDRSADHIWRQAVNRSLFPSMSIEANRKLVRFIARAALQASRQPQPQAQQGGGEVRTAADKAGVVHCPKCRRPAYADDVNCPSCHAALATKEQQR